MHVEVSIPINASKKSIWQIITDIDHAADNIEAIEKIEILEKPEGVLNGLKWRETRTMFGKTATEIMWITDSEAQEFYKTRAESHGMVYVSQLSIETEGDHEKLTMSFDGQADTFIGKLMSGIFGIMMNVSTRKAMLKDLEDIKRCAEGNT